METITPEREKYLRAVATLTVFKTWALDGNGSADGTVKMIQPRLELYCIGLPEIIAASTMIGIMVAFFMEDDNNVDFMSHLEDLDKESSDELELIKKLIDEDED